jgi:hypothetical protein
LWIFPLNSVKSTLTVEVSMKYPVPILLVTIAFSAMVFAQVPTIISHNGYVVDSTGSALNLTTSMTFRFYSDSLAGLETWHQALAGVQVKAGIYQVNLDVTGVDFNNQLWLQTEVGTSVLGPRIRMTSVPYSLSLHLPYSGTITSSSNAMTIVNNGLGKGLDARSTGIGVYGGSTAGTGIQGVSINGFGVRGSSTNGQGVYGTSVTDNGMYGSSDSMPGVYGWSMIDAGIYGTNASANNFGYLGGPAYGAYGKHTGSGNYGYLGGTGNAAGGYNAGFGSGVRGECVNGFGVYGINSTSGNYGLLGTATYGVYGKALSVGGYAGYFDGNVSVNILEIKGGSDVAEPFEI